jgi:hypothetical protein
MAEPTPDLLLDASEDGCCEERGWVEAVVSKERACELIWPFAERYGEPDALPPDPGRVAKVTLAPAKDPATCDWEQQRWHPLAKLRELAAGQDPDDPEVEDLEARLLEAREFWEVPVA